MLRRFAGIAVLLAPVGAYAADLYTPPPEGAPGPSPVSRFFGDFEANAGYSWLFGEAIAGSEADQFWAGGLAARFGYDFGGWLVQGDAFGEWTSVGSAPSSYVSGLGLGGHLAWRDPSRGLLGVFGAWGRTDQDNVAPDTTDIWLLGLEGQVFVGSWTFYGQGGYLDSSGEGPSDSIHQAGFARAVARYFVSPTIKLEASLSGAFGKMDSDNDAVTIVGWGLGIEHQMGSMPLSAFAAYEGASYHQGGNENDTILEHTAKVGLRYQFGGPDLLTQDRQGRSLDLPQFLRWSGLTGGQLE